MTETLYGDGNRQPDPVKRAAADRIRKAALELIDSVDELADDERLGELDGAIEPTVRRSAARPR
jgi:hypothetical protein